MSSQKIFSPEGHIGVGPVAVGGSIGSISKSDTREYSFSSNQCQTCLNVNVINTTISTKPLELCPSGNAPIVIIPHLLSAELTSHEYTTYDVYDLIVKIKRRLVQIHTKWSRNGINPCKKNRLGYKTTLPLKDGFKLNCWVLVDQITTKLAYRLVFGGRMIPCP